jgi:hypothetical protein
MLIHAQTMLDSWDVKDFVQVLFLIEASSMQFVLVDILFI